MKVFITGGTGFTGIYLSRAYLKKGWKVQATGTSPAHPLEGTPDFHYISTDTTQKGKWQLAVKDADAVINLAGRNIFNFWSDSYKKQIYDSRILTTRNLVDSLQPEKKTIFLSASAAGYYGDRGDDILTESEAPGADFLAKVCVDWEAEAMKAKEKGNRVIIMRFGVILGKGGGALSKMIPAFKLFAGGSLGNGLHWFPWLHITDLFEATYFLMENDDAAGPFNFCSPDILRYKQFSRMLGKALNRPSFMQTPAFALKLIMGEMGSAMLNSQRPIPERLEACGFKFKFPQLSNALQDII